MGPTTEYCHPSFTCSSLLGNSNIGVDDFEAQRMDEGEDNAQDPAKTLPSAKTF